MIPTLGELVDSLRNQQRLMVGGQQNVWLVVGPTGWFTTNDSSTLAAYAVLGRKFARVCIGKGDSLGSIAIRASELIGKIHALI